MAPPISNADLQRIADALNNLRRIQVITQQALDPMVIASLQQEIQKVAIRQSIDPDQVDIAALALMPGAPPALATFFGLSPEIGQAVHPFDEKKASQVIDDIALNFAAQFAGEDFPRELFQDMRFFVASNLFTGMGDTGQAVFPEGRRYASSNMDRRMQIYLNGYEENNLAIYPDAPTDADKIGDAITALERANRITPGQALALRGIDNQSEADVEFAQAFQPILTSWVANESIQALPPRSTPGDFGVILSTKLEAENADPASVARGETILPVFDKNLLLPALTEEEAKASAALAAKVDTFAKAETAVKDFFRKQLGGKEITDQDTINLFTSMVVGQDRPVEEILSSVAPFLETIWRAQEQAQLQEEQVVNAQEEFDERQEEIKARQNEVKDIHAARKLVKDLLEDPDIGLGPGTQVGEDVINNWASQILSVYNQSREQEFMPPSGRDLVAGFISGLDLPAVTGAVAPGITPEPKAGLQMLAERFQREQEMAANLKAAGQLGTLVPDFLGPGLAGMAPDAVKQIERNVRLRVEQTGGSISPEKALTDLMGTHGINPLGQLAPLAEAFGPSPLSTGPPSLPGMPGYPDLKVPPVSLGIPEVSLAEMQATQFQRFDISQPPPVPGGPQFTKPLEAEFPEEIEISRLLADIAGEDTEFLRHLRGTQDAPGAIFPILEAFQQEAIPRVDPELFRGFFEGGQQVAPGMSVPQLSAMARQAATIQPPTFGEFLQPRIPDLREQFELLPSTIAARQDAPKIAEAERRKRLRGGGVTTFRRR